MNKTLRIATNALILTESDANIHDPGTWPPGVMMAYHTNDFFALGLVVANDGANIRVVWAQQCMLPFPMYQVDQLNVRSVRRVP